MLYLNSEEVTFKAGETIKQNNTAIRNKKLKTGNMYYAECGLILENQGILPKQTK